MNPKIPIAAITDEFSPDLQIALRAMRKIGMAAAELRVISGKNIMDLSGEELEWARQIVSELGFKVISIASPLLKCVLPNSPEVDQRFQQDVFAAKYSFEDQPKLAERAFAIAKRFDAKIVRVFSFWRTVQPGKCLDAVVKALSELAESAAKHDLIIGLENEHACNIATASETARVLEVVKHPSLMVVWDPANAYVAGEDPFPRGYRLLPASRIQRLIVAGDNPVPRAISRTPSPAAASWLTAPTRSIGRSSARCAFSTRLSSMRVRSSASVRMMAGIQSRPARIAAWSRRCPATTS